MAQIKVFYEPETELLTIFWQAPRLNQIATNLGDDIINRVKWLLGLLHWQGATPPQKAAARS